MLNTRKPRVSYQSARFLTSAEKFTQCPTDSGIEVAFAGRSNAGKSSAINTITQNGKLAKTSKTPGRTQLINFFSLNQPGCHLVDLPGYGYARVSRSVVQSWQKHMQEYLERRQALKALVLVMDVRHPLTEFDCHMLTWCESRGLPTLVLLTKADKLKPGIAKRALYKAAKELQRWSHAIDVQLFSSLKKIGTDDARHYLDQFFLAAIADPAEEHVDSELS